MGLMADIEHNVAYICLEYLKWYAYGLSEVCNGLIVLVLYAKIQHNAYELKGGVTELLIEL